MEGCLALAENIPAPDTRDAVDEERALIDRARQGDRAAFGELVRLYDQQVLRLVLRIVASPEDARDLYQEVFLKVFRSLDRFRFDSRFSTWLYRIVMNVCLDHLRRQKARDETQAPASEHGEPEFFQAFPDDKPAGNPERAYQSGEVRRRIEKALERFPDNGTLKNNLNYCKEQMKIK